MKIRIEIDNELSEEEIIIKCREVNPSVLKMQQIISDSIQDSNFVFYKDNVEFYLPTEQILFFEVSGNFVNAHTEKDVYIVKQKLCQVEDKLPLSFIRVSKSTILNCDHVLSIDRHITSFSTVSFARTHKQVFVSRNYLKGLSQRMNERRGIK